MFAWNIAKSAETMFTQFAVKRVCKFLLKKKLGQFILGDIDLDQLDVQLRDGTIQLSDLSLNVDFINNKFVAAAPVIVKEGSIGSLLVKLPWSGQGCQVEVDELEIVLAPCVKNSSVDGDESHRNHQDSEQCNANDLGKLDRDMVDGGGKPAPGEVHEGVKTIAKMVKWLLTSFHVRIKKLIIAFDPYQEQEKKNTHRILVFRVSQIECGTFISEDANVCSDRVVDSFLGISRLTNYANFRGAILELLQMDDAEEQRNSSAVSETAFSELYTRCSLTNFATPIVTGEVAGFSGNLKLSIPLKNGSLDIHTVDADLSVEPLELRLQPSTIKWLLHSWNNCNNLDKDGRDHFADSVYDNASSLWQLPEKDSGVDGAASPAKSSSMIGLESVTEALLPASHIISDWVPFSTNRNANNEAEEDLGASMDQFFECFDGLRNSHSALGSSGMWNWTCSVFSAITAASSLASGSMQIPSEQRHLETNLKATIAGISITLLFQDEEQKRVCDLRKADSGISYLGSECRDIFLVLQVCPHEKKLEGKVKYIEVCSYRSKNNVRDFTLGHNQNILSPSFQHLQAEVQAVLPNDIFCTDFIDSNEAQECLAGDCSPNKGGDEGKITLVKTSGVTNFQVTIRARKSGGSYSGPSLFSLKLPPLIFWVDFYVVNKLLDLSKEITSSVEVNNQSERPWSEDLDAKHSYSADVNKGSGPHITSLSSTEMMQGNITISSARVMLCFPFGTAEKSDSHSSWNEFIALDFSLASNLGKDSNSLPRECLENRFPSTISRSLCLSFGNLDVHLISESKDAVMNARNIHGQRFYAQNLLSITNKVGCLSAINMIWQDGQVTGPWVAKRAKFLATSEPWSSHKYASRGYEFVSATTLKDLKDSESQIREEIILSSAFFLHICLSPVTITLSRSQYETVYGLITQMLNSLSGLTKDAVSNGKESCSSQSSILVVCEEVEISISPDMKENIRSSLQSELPGCWHHLKLRVQKFEMLSASDIGGVRGANFFWLAHGEGNLWGSITSDVNQEFSLISCSNTSMKRGDGGGSNVLSSRVAGLDLVHLWEPDNSHGSMSINIRCATIIAVGGRLDWLETISSFFSLPSKTAEEANDSSLPKGDSKGHSGAFVLNLVDCGLSYEPYFTNLMVRDELSTNNSSYLSAKDKEPPIACLLAASCLNLSNTTVPHSSSDEYKIIVQDLGLLLCQVLETNNYGGGYGVERLRNTGYTKIAREAYLEAVLRTNCESGLLWEVECSKCHIDMGTCHDTTSGLIRLAAQLQQLVAPDLEESAIQNIQLAQERANLYGESLSLASQTGNSTVATESKSECLMDKICDNAFQSDEFIAGQSHLRHSQFHISLDEDFYAERHKYCTEKPGNFSHNLSLSNSAAEMGMESNQSSSAETDYVPEFIDSYCVSELHPTSGKPIGNQMSPETLECISGTTGNGDLEKRNEGNGWYVDASLRILENHIAESSKQGISKQSSEESISVEDKEPFNTAKASGRVLFKDVSIRWKMYDGSDWHHMMKSSQHSMKLHGRDKNICLELVLSGLDFQYDVFPVGGICASKLSVSVQDFWLYDQRTDAPWKLVLGYYHSKDRPRESRSKGLKVELEAVRPDPNIPLEEYRLRISVLPVRLNLHQSQLDFFINYFGARSSKVDQSLGHHPDSNVSKLPLTDINKPAWHAIEDGALLPYFQKLEIFPVLIRVDYQPHHVDLAALKDGKYVELVNLVPWKGVELQLKHVHAVGLYGWGSVFETIIGEWLEDISHNQVHKILQGLPTIRSLVAVGNGAVKLVTLPIENYRRDHRLLKGTQRGTISFLRSISLEAIGLGVHLAAGAHEILSQAEYILASMQPSVQWPAQSQMKSNYKSNQPKNAQQGIHQAYESLSDGLGKSASALVRTPLKKYQRGSGAGSALATAVKAVPAATIAPVSACATAVRYALLGLRNSLDPEHKKESLEKYLGPPEPQSRSHDD